MPERATHNIERDTNCGSHARLGSRHRGIKITRSYGVDAPKLQTALGRFSGTRQQAEGRRRLETAESASRHRRAAAAGLAPRAISALSEHARTRRADVGDTPTSGHDDRHAAGVR